MAEQRFSAAFESTALRYGALAPQNRMTIPYRGTTGDGTYFITASAFQKNALLQSERMALLFIETLFQYRNQEKFFLHEFVVMPDHIHLLITPIVTLERTVQFIKGGFSYRAGKLFGLRGTIWQTSFYDRRVRDALEYARFKSYIYQNPIKRGLVSTHAQFPYGSASAKFDFDEVPQRLKPVPVGEANCSAQALLHP